MIDQPYVALGLPGGSKPVSQNIELFTYALIYQKNNHLIEDIHSWQETQLRLQKIIKSIKLFNARRNCVHQTA